MEYDFELEATRILEEIAGEPSSDRLRIDAYIQDVANYMGINPDVLVYRILKEWAYSRSFGREVS